jgi:zinc D-Ala-D-Ala carboxypeptidase
VSAVPGDIKSIQGALAFLGWPVVPDGVNGPNTHQAITDFQHAWTATNLVLDGYAGPVTCDAINYCGYIGKHLSPHFVTFDFKSKGNGWIRANRTELRALEKLRAVHYPNGLVVVSGYRDPAYNHSVGGAANSQHLYGSGCDIHPTATVAQVRKLGVFSGIGYQGNTGLVRHVDVRGQDGAPSTTAGTVSSPTIWRY